MDQDFSTLRRMRAANNVYQAVNKLRSLQGDAVNTQLSINERLLLGELREAGMLGGVGLGG